MSRSQGIAPRFSFKQGNILEESAEALVNAVNCVGVMGKGLALQFKQAFPENFHKYKNACAAQEVQAGKMFIVATEQLFLPKCNPPSPDHIEFIATDHRDSDHVEITLAVNYGQRKTS